MRWAKKMKNTAAIFVCVFLVVACGCRTFESVRRNSTLDELVAQFGQPSTVKTNVMMTATDVLKFSWNADSTNNTLSRLQIGDRIVEYRWKRFRRELFVEFVNDERTPSWIVNAR